MATNTPCRRKLSPHQCDLLVQAIPYISRMAARHARLPMVHTSAEDLAQIATLAVAEALARGTRPKGNPIAYVCGIARFTLGRWDATHGGLITTPRRAKGYHPPLSVLSLDRRYKPGSTLTLADSIEEGEVRV